MPAGSLENDSLVVDAPVVAWLGEDGVIFEHAAPINAAVKRHTSSGRKFAVVGYIGIKPRREGEKPLIVYRRENARALGRRR
jgi:hypothetical protein